jgi:thioredoxin reductase
MKQEQDLIVIGAGPAGISAATTASSHGLRVTLIDEGPIAGGQIYRATPKEWKRKKVNSTNTLLKVKILEKDCQNQR